MLYLKAPFFKNVYIKKKELTNLKYSCNIKVLVFKKYYKIISTKIKLKLLTHLIKFYYKLYKGGIRNE